MSGLFNLLAKLLDLAKDVPGWRRNRRRADRLRELLSDPRYEWRSIDTLAKGVGLTPEQTRDMLISIGAQRSTGSAEVWRLPGR